MKLRVATLVIASFIFNIRIAKLDMLICLPAFVSCCRAPCMYMHSGRREGATRRSVVYNSQHQCQLIYLMDFWHTQVTHCISLCLSELGTHSSIRGSFIRLTFARRRNSFFVPLVHFYLVVVVVANLHTNSNRSAYIHVYIRVYMLYTHLYTCIGRNDDK